MPPDAAEQGTIKIDNRHLAPSLAVSSTTNATDTESRRLGLDSADVCHYGNALRTPPSWYCLGGSSAHAPVLLAPSAD